MTFAQGYFLEQFPSGGDEGGDCLLVEVEVGAVEVVFSLVDELNYFEHQTCKTQSRQKLSFNLLVGPLF